MTRNDDFDRLVRDWLSAEGGHRAPAGLARATTMRTAARRPRPGWLVELRGQTYGAVVDDRRSPLGRPLILTLLAGLLVVALVAGLMTTVGAPRPKVLVPSQPPTTSVPLVIASPHSSATTATQTPAPVDVGRLCRPGSPANLPSGPLPVSSRPSSPPTNDGYLTIGGAAGPDLVDSMTGDSLGAVKVKSEGTLLSLPFVGSSAWSPDGRWLALRYWSDQSATACDEELIVSSDRTRAIDVTGYPKGLGLIDALWSPDGRWLAVESGSRIDVFGVAPDGTVSGARTVWRGQQFAYGSAWGPDGTLAFVLQDGNAKSGTTVAFLAAGASTPRLVPVPIADRLSPLAWTTDGAAVVATGDVGQLDVGIFRITSSGASRLPLANLVPPGFKWADVPLTVVGDRIVFVADQSAPEVNASTALPVLDGDRVYAISADGSRLTLLSDPDGGPVSEATTLAAAPDGHRVAVLSASISVIDLADGSWQQLSTRLYPLSGIISWQPGP